MHKFSDLHKYISTGDRPNGGDYYLGFLNNEEWELQIYSGRYQVNFCKKDESGMFNPVAVMVFDTTYHDVKCVKVTERGYADYDHPILYSMEIPLNRVNWLVALGPIGPTIHEVINRIMQNR